MIPNVVQAIMESKAKKVKLWPINSNRASEMGHPCERYLVYLRTRGNERQIHTAEKQMIFDDGSVHEEAVLKDIQEAGFKIIEQQRYFEWKKYQITGSIDAKILWEGKAIPIEIKSFSDWNWKAINSIEDMFKSKSVFMRKYPAQLTLYLIMDEKEEGIFILKNKNTSMLKQIDLKLDYDYAESLIQKAERVNQHVQNQTLPDRIPYSELICDYCSFYHICLPETINPGKIVVDEEIASKLARREELKAFKDEFEKLDKEIKEKFYQVEEAMVENWVIKGKWVEKKEYIVPAGKYWTVTIKKMGAVKDE